MYPPLRELSFGEAGVNGFSSLSVDTVVDEPGPMGGESALGSYGCPGVGGFSLGNIKGWRLTKCGFSSNSSRNMTGFLWLK